MQKIVKKIVLLSILLCSNFALFAQFTYGTTGLLHMPTAEMQDDKTFIVGGNYLHNKITPNPWTYGTYNYFLNITIFPFLEVAYTATMFKAKTIGIDWKVDGEKFTNQDRYFSFRLRVIEEGKYWKYMPAIVVGTSDPYTESGDGQISTASGNGYFCRFYVAATKHFRLGAERFGVHLAYIYNNRISYHYNGVAVGLSYNPSFAPQLRLIAEYDSRDFSIGATYELFNQLHAQVQLQNCKYFTGGLAYKVHLK
jgi:hypothetical protein